MSWCCGSECPHLLLLLSCSLHRALYILVVSFQSIVLSKQVAIASRLPHAYPTNEFLFEDVEQLCGS